MPIPWFRCLCLALGLGAMACASAAPTGYRGDDSGRFADAPPTARGISSALHIT